MIQKIKNKWNNLEKPNKLEFGLLFILLLACFLVFNHPDLLCTSTHGRILLNLSFKGKFFEFYDFTQATAVYLIPIYIIFAIWSIPVKIIYAIFNIPYWHNFNYGSMQFVTQLWYKLLPVVFCIGTAVILWKIAKIIKMSEDKKRWMIFTFLGFPILVFAQFIFGQYDSINMFFTTLAIYYFLQRKYYKFSFAMSMAISLKLFPLFIFIPLILMIEKRIIHIVKYLLIGISTTAFSNLLFIGSKGFATAKEFTTDMVERFFVSGFQTAHGTISFFLLIVIFACVICYIKTFDKKNEKEFQYYVVYICLLIYSSFYIFILWHPQWVILLVPFWILSMFMFENIKVSYILSVFLGIGYIFNTVIFFPGNVDESMINQGILPQLFNHYVPLDGGIRNILAKSNYASIDMFMTIFGAVLIINLIMKFPTKKRLDSYKKGINEKMPEKGYILGLVASILLFILPAIYLFIK